MLILNGKENVFLWTVNCSKKRTQCQSSMDYKILGQCQFRCSKALFAKDKKQTPKLQPKKKWGGSGQENH